MPNLRISNIIGSSPILKDSLKPVYNSANSAPKANFIDGNIASLDEKDKTSRSFQTVGGEWRMPKSESSVSPMFYSDGANTSNTKLFDHEFYQDSEDQWIQLSAKGGADRSKMSAEQYNALSDFERSGWQKVSPENVPPQYSTDGRKISLSNESFAADPKALLKRYLVDQNLVSNWDEVHGTRAIEGALQKGAKIEVLPTGEKTADGKTVYSVKMDKESLTILRNELRDYEKALQRDAQAAEIGKAEAGRMVSDMIGGVWETGRKAVDYTINSVQDTFNMVLEPTPFYRLSPDAPNFGRAKVGEMYDTLEKSTNNLTGAPLPRISTEFARYDFQSEYMRRDLNGKLDGDGIKRGELSTSIAGALTPLLINKIATPVESPQTLKNLGGLPETKSVIPVEARNTQPSLTQSIENRFPNEPLPSDGKIIGTAKIEKGKITSDFKIPADRQVDFIVDKQGNLVLGNRHSFLANGANVQAAGTMKVINGKVKAITNLSGHYQPSIQQSKNFPRILSKLGLDLKNTKLEISAFENTKSGYVIGRGKIVINVYLK